MAFYLSLTEVDKARQVAERALKTINLREENEKLNVWVAWLNLENTYGTQDTLLKVFNNALIFNEPKVIYIKLAEIYERAEKTDEAEKLFKTMCKKFKESAKIWKKYASYLLHLGKVEEFRNIMPQSLKSLPKRKHIPIISKFAQLEFKFGAAERGRTIFEGILSNYPKRVDIWNIFIDMELKVGETDTIRHLFERVTSLNLSSKKMKHFFKRYFNFEKEIGDESRVTHVKQKAQQYVDSKTE